MSHIERNRGIWREAVRCHPRSVASNLFLHRIECDNVPCGLLPLREVLHHLCDDEPTESVIECACNNSILPEFTHSLAINHGAPYANPHCSHLLFILGTDINNKIVDFGGFLLFSLANVDRDIADNPLHLSLLSEDCHSPSTCSCCIRSPNQINRQKSSGQEVLHHVADLVAVRLEHQSLLRSPL